MTFTQFAANRGTNCWKQFAALFKRNWQYLVRNPRSFNGIVFNGIFTGLLTLALFIHIGRYTPDMIDPGNYQFIGYVYNLSGLGFMLANNISFSSSNSVIIEMPLMVPVFKRELANKMYTPSTYYFGKFFSHMILQLAYPFTFVLCVFWGLSISEKVTNFFMFVIYAGLLNLTMNAQGYFCGCMSDDEETAKQINTFMILLMMLTSGGLGNVKAFPDWITGLSYLSPQRYACQGFFYRLIQHVPEPAQSQMKETIGYTSYGDAACISALCACFMFFTIGGWLIINYRNRNK